MPGVLVNVGDPAACRELAEWQIRWIREEPRYRALGVRFHRDPEFETFTYGDYPWKPAKVNLAKMQPGDWIFFNETLIVNGQKLRFVIACFSVLERVSYEELAAAELLDDARYAGNAHVGRNRLIPDSDTRFAIWRGGPESRLLDEPLLMDRQFIEELGLRSQTGGLWDWEQRDVHGRRFTELQLIGFHTRATRWLSKEQTSWLLDRMSERPVRAEVVGITPHPNHPPQGGRGQHSPSPMDFRGKAPSRGRGQAFAPLPLGEPGRAAAGGEDG